MWVTRFACAVEKAVNMYIVTFIVPILRYDRYANAAKWAEDFNWNLILEQ